MAYRKLPNPFANVRYLVEVDGVPRGVFGSCSGLEVEHRHVEFYFGPDAIDLFDVYSPNHEERVILAEGIALDDMLPEWEHANAEGHVERHDGSIVAIDEFGRPCARWRFHGAWPEHLESGGAVGDRRRRIESVELICDDIRMN
ncbi:phage tail protein [Candidatus Chloroploca asiatica]|uniref:Phage tail protein n=1 Tax=Candidatus Chloroploca asiatica TaxID=1506545 RepID=A0A2H3LAJ6_9CHLR|nr:phage tail protein [Candidatus Chloroploca asiatica]PDV99399.1 hypothetical protein A9Q02_12190 [Candidatus Chloroploca asiatica]